MYSSPISLRRQHPDAAGPLIAQRHRADIGAHQLLHREADLGEHPPDDALAPLVQRHPHHRLARHRVDHREVVDMRRAVVQFDPVAQLAPRPRGTVPMTVAR